MSRFFVFWLLVRFFTPFVHSLTNCGKYLCSHYYSDNKVLYGRNIWTSYSVSGCSIWYANPIEYPSKISVHYRDDCWMITDTPYSTEYQYARCSICDPISVNSSSPLNCPSWNISSKIDDGFTFNDGICYANSNISLSLPEEICAYNISTEWYRSHRNIYGGDWILYDVDSNGNGYYFSNGLLYFYKMSANISNISSTEIKNDNDWVWAIAAYILNPHPFGFCLIVDGNESIEDCQIWYFFDSTDNYISTTYVILPYKCPLVNEISDVVCVTGSKFPLELELFQLQEFSYNWNGFRSLNTTVTYDISYQDFHWIIGSEFNNKTYEYSNFAECSVFTTPFNLTKCNGYWIVNNGTDDSSLFIFSSLCNVIPSHMPTIPPTYYPPTITAVTNESLSDAPTISPTFASINSYYIVSDDKKEYLMFILFSITIIFLVIICLILATIYFVRRNREKLMAQMKIEVKKEVLRVVKLLFNDLGGVADAYSGNSRGHDDRISLDGMVMPLDNIPSESREHMSHLKTKSTIVTNDFNLETIHAEQIMDEEKEIMPYDTLMLKMSSSSDDHINMVSNALLQNRIFPGTNSTKFMGAHDQHPFGRIKSENICNPSIENDKTLPRAPCNSSMKNKISVDGVRPNAASVPSFQTIFEEEKDYVINDSMADVLLSKESGAVFSISELDEDEDLSKELFSSFVSTVDISNSDALTDAYTMKIERKENIGDTYPMMVLVECEEGTMSPSLEKNKTNSTSA